MIYSLLELLPQFCSFTGLLSRHPNRAFWVRPAFLFPACSVHFRIHCQDWSLLLAPPSLSSSHSRFFSHCFPLLLFYFPLFLSPSSSRPLLHLPSSSSSYSSEIPPLSLLWCFPLPVSLAVIPSGSHVCVEKTWGQLLITGVGGERSGRRGGGAPKHRW